jgi:uncharacterized protein
MINDAFLSTLRDAGVTTAAIFGSVSIGQETEQSDLDLLVSFARPITLFEQLDLAERLSMLCGRQVDLVVKLNPVFEPYIAPTLRPLPL